MVRGSELTEAFIVIKNARRSSVEVENTSTLIVIPLFLKACAGVAYPFSETFVGADEVFVVITP